MKTSDSVVDFNTEIPITFTVTIKTETFQFITLLTWINRVCVSETQKKTENPRYICDIYTLVIHQSEQDMYAKTTLIVVI